MCSDATVKQHPGYNGRECIAVQLLKTLALKVAAALARSGLSAHRLELEITEAVLIRDDEQTLATLHQLRQLGVRISLDRFWHGLLSSLSYLQRFPFEQDQDRPEFH